MRHSASAKRTRPAPVMAARKTNCFAATVTPYMDFDTTLATTAAHIGTTTARTWETTAASLVNAPPPNKHVTAHAVPANAPAPKPTCCSNPAIFRAAALSGTLGKRYLGMNAWPAWMSGSPHSTATAKTFPAILCAAETVTPSPLANKISAV